MIIEKGKETVDDLTGALNRKVITPILEQEIKRAKRYGEKSSLLFIDLDNFKQVNDLQGHLQGDKVLINFVKLLKEVLRESDIIIRYGGDEFIVVLPNTPLENATLASDRILKAVENEEILNKFNVSCSIGIVEIPTHGEDIRTILDKADQAMYKAKRLGKRRYYVHREEILTPQIPSQVFVDRKTEKQKFLSILSEKFKLILVKGPLGVGKSRFVAESLKFSDTEVIKISCYGTLSLVPYAPFQELTKKLKERNVAEFNEAISQMDEIKRSSLSPLIPFQIERKEFQLDIYKFYETYLDLMEKLFEYKNFYLFIDDIQWMDASSSRLLFYIIRNMKKDIKIIATARQEEVESTPFAGLLPEIFRENLVKELELHPLDKEATEELIKAILLAPFDESLTRFVFQETGGNPLFIEELLRKLYTQELLRFEDEEWKFELKNNISIPENLNILLKEKLKDFLNEKLVQIAAVIGQEFHIDLLEQVTNYNRGQIYDIVDKLRKQNFIDEIREDFYSFKAGLIRDTILSQISEAKRRYYSSTILEALEKRFPDFQGKDELCAYHAKMSGDREKIKKYCKLVAENLKKKLAYEESIIYYYWYIEAEDDPVEREKAVSEYCELLEIRGEIKRSINFLQEYIAQNQISELSYRTLAQLFVESGDPTSALEAIEKAIAMERKPESIVIKSWILRRLFKIDDSAKILEELLRSEGENLNGKTKGDVYNILGFDYMELNKLEEALEYLNKAKEIREKENDLRGIGSVHVNLAILYSRMDRYEEALKEYDLAEEYFEKVGYKSGIATVLNNRAGIYLDLMMYKEALENFKKTYTECKKTFDRHLLSMALNNIGVTLRHLEKHDEAIETLLEAKRIAEELNQKDILISIKRNLAYTYAVGYRDTENSKSLIGEVLDAIGAPGKTYPSLIAFLHAIEIYLISNEVIKATELLSKIEPNLLNSVYDGLKMSFLGTKVALEKLTNNNQSTREYIGAAKEVLKGKEIKSRVLLLSNFLESYADVMIYLGKIEKGINMLKYLRKSNEKYISEQEAERLEKKVQRIKKLFNLDNSEL